MTAVPTKPCRDCGFPRLLTDFYAAHGMRDGRSNTCRECAKQIALEAKRHGHTIATRRRAFEQTGRCAQCESLPWRRSKPCCPVCSELYRAESTGSMRAAVLERKRYVG